VRERERQRERDRKKERASKREGECYFKLMLFEATKRSKIK